MAMSSTKIMIIAILLALLGLFSAKVGYQFGSDLAEKNKRK